MGPVEGHRLKTIKRQMYGRAGVELLRARLLPESFLRRAPTLSQNLISSCHVLLFKCSVTPKVQ